MTDKERIERISELLKKLDLAELTYDEFDELFPEESINDIKEELWLMYCFASDVCVTINMK